MIDLAKTQADCDARQERVEAMLRAVIDTVREMTAAITLRSPQARTRLGDEGGANAMTVQAPFTPGQDSEGGGHE